MIVRKHQCRADELCIHCSREMGDNHHRDCFFVMDESDRNVLSDPSPSGANDTTQPDRIGPRHLDEQEVRE